MEYTEKQIRNGAVGSTGEQNTAVPGPDATSEIARAISSAMATGRYAPPASGGS